MLRGNESPSDVHSIPHVRSEAETILHLYYSKMTRPEDANDVNYAVSESVEGNVFCVHSVSGKVPNNVAKCPYGRF